MREILHVLAQRDHLQEICISIITKNRCVGWGWLLYKRDLTCTVNQFMLKGSWCVHRCLFLLWILWQVDERIFFLLYSEQSVDFNHFDQENCWYVKCAWEAVYVLSSNRAKFTILYN